MKNNFQKISSEILEKALEAIQSKEIQDVIVKTKASTDSGTFEVVISTADQDRQGEIIDQKGWDFTNYMNNPVVLWAHNYCDLPIGVTDELFLDDKGQTVAKGRFAPEEANSFAQQVRRLYDAKIVKTASVGFIARETDGNTITKAELLEFSFVPVPANPMALSLAKELKLDTAELMTKGIFIKADPPLDEPAKPEEPVEVPGDSPPADAPNDPEEQTDQELITKVGAELAAIQSETDSLIITHSKEIINLITAGEDTDETEEAKAAKTERARTLMSRAHIISTINGLKATVAALEETLEGDERHEHPDGDASKQRSNDAGSDIVEALKTYNANQRVLRLVNNVTSEALRKINVKNTRVKK